MLSDHTFIVLYMYTCCQYRDQYCKCICPTASINVGIVHFRAFRMTVQNDYTNECLFFVNCTITLCAQYLL